MSKCKVFLENACSRRGAQFGRPDLLPEMLKNVRMKLHLQLVPRNSGGYDAGGAYWGWSSDGKQLYVAFDNIQQIRLFRWAKTREEAKIEIQGEMAYAIFYR